jgi:hypothetical protein
MFIRFEADQAPVVEDAFLAWQRSLTRVPGQIGGTMVMSVWGTPIGTTVSRKYPSEFLPVLKTKKVRFTVE